MSLTVSGSVLHFNNLPAWRILSQLFFLCLFFFLPEQLQAQSTGYINRPATSPAGRAVLDPNSDGYSSQTTAGYMGNDVLNSEISFKPVPAFSVEPFGDLRRGPSHLYSDFVPDENNVGNYVHFNGSQLLFRWRMGSVMSGSKGYSILIDTDNKFGSSGDNADPNFQAETTGTNGNPGFEIEVVLETNFRIAIYNVDGTSSPVLIKSYANWQDMSQVSVAGTFDNGDPDFFIDFYIPFSDLEAAPFNLTTSSPLRMSATTVMAPKPAIGGPKSDIYGMGDSNYKTASQQYESFINAQPPFTPTGITTNPMGSICTAPPAVTSPIGTGTVVISGTWTRSNLTTSTDPATITVFRNGTVIGTITGVASGATWNLPGIASSNGDIFTARAQATGESQCLSSNAVRAQGCNTSNIPSSTGLSVTCNSTRGLEGAFPSGHEVRLYYINPTTLVTSLLAGPAANSPTFGYTATTWYYNGSAFNGSQISSACSGGSPDMNSGTYYVTTSLIGGSCESAPVFSCNGIGTTTATPVITQSLLYTTDQTVSGTATAGANVYLRINGQLINTTVATGGAFSFTGLTLALGDLVEVQALTTNNCISLAASRTVRCYTSAPLITVDNNEQLAAGLPITGTSNEPVGTTIRVYTGADVLVSTISVQANGTWTTGSYLALSGTSYYATAQNGTCNVSTASATYPALTATTGRCGTITSPVTAGDASISGTVTGSVSGTIVNLYLDGQKIGSVTTTTNTWTINTSALSDPIYNYGILSIGVQETGRLEQYCSASLVTVTCNNGPATPIISPTTSNLVTGQSQTYTISNAEVGAFYGLADATTGRSLGNGVWASSSTITVTTNSFPSGTYNLVIKGTSLTGVNVCSSPTAAASINVNGTLPATVLNFWGKWEKESIKLNWITESEINVSHYEVERSVDGIIFNSIGQVKATNLSGRHQYSFTDLSPSTKNFYRLKIVDLNGVIKTSRIISFSKNTEVHIYLSPNPFTTKLNIKVELEQRQDIRVELLDIAGRPLASQDFAASNGINQLVWDGLSHLAPGVYILKVTSGEGTNLAIKKIIKH